MTREEAVTAVQEEVIIGTVDNVRDAHLGLYCTGEGDQSDLTLYLLHHLPPRCQGYVQTAAF